MTRIVQPTSGAIRAANRVRVVDVLRHAGAATRAELAEQTGLSRATISSLVGDLARRGLVSERRTPPDASRAARPPRWLLQRSAGVAIAVDVGGRHVAVAVGDLRLDDRTAVGAGAVRDQRAAPVLLTAQFEAAGPHPGIADRTGRPMET